MSWVFGGNISLSQLSVLDGGEWLAPSYGSFIGERAPSIHRSGGWMDLRADLNPVEERKIYAHIGNPNPGFRTSSL
jgi:hypothetical protein